MMKLYSYFRSSSSYRVRIALNLKKINYQVEVVDLLKGEETEKNFLAKNPQGLVPALLLSDGDVLTQSTAIIEYLDATYPEPRLISQVNTIAAKQRAMTAVIASEIQPLNNLKVLQYLRNNLSVDKSAEQEWYQHWVSQSFDVLEKQVEAVDYAMGDEVSIVDVFLIPQIFNAIRFNVRLDRYPKLMRIYEACNQLPEFIDAAPQNHEVKVKTNHYQFE